MRVQVKEDSLWAEWTDVAFSRLDSNGDGFISLDEIVSIMPASYSEGEDAEDAHLVALSQVRILGFKPPLYPKYRV